MNSVLSDHQEEEIAQEEELQEGDQQVIEPWTRNVKACTCDCESAELPPRISTVISATSQPPPPPKNHLLACMPGEVTVWVEFRLLSSG